MKKSFKYFALAITILLASASCSKSDIDAPLVHEDVFFYIHTDLVVDKVKISMEGASKTYNKIETNDDGDRYIRLYTFMEKGDYTVKEIILYIENTDSFYRPLRKHVKFTVKEGVNKITLIN